MEVCLPQQIPVPQPLRQTPPGERAALLPAPGGVSRTWQIVGLVALFAGLAAALLFSGAAAARQVSDPGALVRWGLPVSKALHNISLATVIGGLIFAVGILPRSLGRLPVQGRGRRRSIRPLPAPWRSPRRAGAVWTLSAIAVLVLGYADVAGQGLSGDAEFTRSLVYFMTDIETGRAWLAVVIIAAVVTTALFGVRSLGGLAATLRARAGGPGPGSADRPLLQLG